MPTNPCLPRVKNDPPSASRIRMAVLVNQCATPGLGSLMAGRYIAGTLQLLLALAGFVFIVAWLFSILKMAYSLMDTAGTSEPVPPHWLGWTGLVCFGAAWLWAGATSISLLLASRRVRQDRWQEMLARPEQAGTPPKLKDESGA